MKYDFLKNFPKRMNHVGMYVLLIQNSMQKQTWRQYGFVKTDEQFNVIFALLLYLMEQSLKEEPCTMDDIGAFLDDLNSGYFEKNMSYEDCRKLGDFIVNVILSNEGKTMYFDGYDFEQKAYQIMHISYVANRIIYLDTQLKRTSYYLTDDGYNLLLSTLEIENNMKLTIHEMIFKMHLERQSYDKAVDEIKNVFNLLRIQLQRIQEAMLRVRRNALNYSVTEYRELLEADMETIDTTKQKFQNYRETVRKRAKELEEQNINVDKLSKEDEEKLDNLRIIESYLNRGLDEHQKILNSHFDLKLLYDRELEQLSQMSLIRRFSFRTELYDQIMQNADALDDLAVFLRPLFHRNPSKSYNLLKAMELQRPLRKDKQEEQEESLEDFDEETWQREHIRRKKERLAKYEGCLIYLLEMATQSGEITLQQIAGAVSEDEQAAKLFLPEVDIFKEIMVELIKAKEINITALRKEKRESISEESLDFQLNEMLLSIVDSKRKFAGIECIRVMRTNEDQPVEFQNVADSNGNIRNIRCSNVRIILERRD